MLEITITITKHFVVTKRSLRVYVQERETRL